MGIIDVIGDIIEANKVEVETYTRNGEKGYKQLIVRKGYSVPFLSITEEDEELFQVIEVGDGYKIESMLFCEMDELGEIIKKFLREVE